MSVCCTDLVWQPGVTAWPSSAVTSAEQAGALGGLGARPKGQSSQGPAWSSVMPSRRLAVWSGMEEKVGLDQ